MPDNGAYDKWDMWRNPSHTKYSPPTWEPLEWKLVKWLRAKVGV